MWRQYHPVTRIKQWLKNTSHDLENSTFYSDTHNGLSLLEIVTIAVDPDEQLKTTALDRDWEIRNFR